MSDIIRVLHVVGSLGIGGIQSYLMNIYRTIDRSRVQFDFVVHIKTKDSYINEIESYGGKVYYIPDNAFERNDWRKYLNFWRSFYINHPEYRIVHGHLRSTSAIYLYEAKKAGCYVIAHSHATNNGYGLSGTIKDIAQYPTRYIANYFMGCSQEANVWMFGKKIARSKSCIVLNNGIDIEKFKYNDELRHGIRKKWGVDDDVKIIGTVGRLVEQKNQEVLISAMPKILENSPKSILIIVGEGPLKGKLEKMINTLGLSSCIRLLGARKDINQLLNSFDLFVLPSRNEGLGISAIEAQANGLPVLVSSTVPKETRISEQVKVVKNNDVNTWSFAIIDALEIRRKDNTADIQKAGYDIKKIACWLSDFYCNKVDYDLRRAIESMHG